MYTYVLLPECQLDCTYFLDYVPLSLSENFFLNNKIDIKRDFNLFKTLWVNNSTNLWPLSAVLGIVSYPWRPFNPGNRTSNKTRYCRMYWCLKFLSWTSWYTLELVPTLPTNTLACNTFTKQNLVHTTVAHKI